MNGRSPLRDTPALPPEHVSVVGAGIVGVSTALYLRLAGVPVTLFDRSLPGHGCSSGNAGMLGVDSCVPVALPGTPTKIPGMLRSAGGPLGIHLPNALEALPWFARFALASRPHRVEAIARALNSLQRQLWSAYSTLLEVSDAGDLVRQAGKIHLCESEAVFAETEYARALQRANGVELSVIGPAEIRQLAPALTRNIVRGAYYPNAVHSIHPLTMIERFAQAFTALGGAFVRDEIRDIQIGPTGPTSLRGAEAVYPIRRMVLSAGIGSGRLARSLGAHVPMIAHRGYNVTLPASPDALPLPIKSEDRKILLTPMKNGIRITGIAEIADPDHAPNPDLHERIVKHARALLPECREDPVEPWLGSRPCTPDSLPVIGHSSRFPSVVFAFGHGHLGLGLGAITGRVVCELLTSGAPSVDLAPFRPDRFRLAARRAPAPREAAFQ